MKTIANIAGMFLLFALSPFFSWAQTYDKWWKEVETLQRKDLPKSAMGVLDKIYTKAESEKNLPQMMKARIWRADYQSMITPDSAEVEETRLTKWAESETDTVAQAVLYSLLGSSLSAQGQMERVDEAIGCFRRSLQHRELLGQTPACTFVPMTIAGRLSERYLGDSMYDLLAREAIRSLSSTWSWHRMGKVQEEIAGMYEELIAFYGDRNREAALLTRLAKAEWQARREVLEKRFQLTDEAYARLLDGWMKDFGGLDICAEVYLRRAALYERTGDLRHAHRIAEEGLRRYPESETAAALKALVERIEMPSLSADLPFVYPEDEAEVHLSYKNLTGIQMELYRLHLSPDSPELNRREDEEVFVRKYGKKRSVQTWVLKPTGDFLETDTVLRYRLPEAGIYLLKLIPEGYAEKTVYEVLHVSPYQCVSLPADGKYRELVAVDKRSGQPVPGAEIVLYKEKEKGGYEAVKVYTTDAKGSVRTDWPDDRVLQCNVRTPGNDFMAVGMVTARRHRMGRKDEEWSRMTSLFTDRSLYRPGQTVYVSGVVYRQRGDSLQVVPQEEGEAALYLNGKEWKKIQVRTDAWGTFRTEFVLPRQTGPGEARIAAYGRSEYIRVEEYKRPTFDVTFMPYDKTYAIGDSVKMEGQARTFAGAPVRNAEVGFQVVRALRWFWMPGGKGDEIQTGTVKTDGEGRFTLPVCLAKPDTETRWGQVKPYYTYTVTAEVTDGAGETQRGQTVWPVGECSIGLQIEGLNGTVAREKNETLRFRTQNLNGIPVDTEVTYRVFAIGSGAEKDTLKYEGKVLSQKAFVPQEVWRLPAGAYRMEASASDGQGRECKTEQDFVLFSTEEKRLPVKAVEWFYREESVWDESHPVNLYVGSCEDSVYLFVDVYTAEKRIESKRMYLSNEVVKLSYPYRAAYGNGMTVHMAFMKNGNWYSRQERMVRLEPDKKLRMKWETFRDRLSPGSEEEWRMQITDGKGRPVCANLMAVLYDASLDKLYGHHWNFSLHFNRITPYVDGGVLWNGQRVGLYCPFVYGESGSRLRIDEWGDYSRLWKPQYDREEAFWFAGNGEWARPAAVELKYMASKRSADGVFEEERVPVQEEPMEAAPEEAEDTAPIALPLRENFTETAFFYPQLRTDSAGQVSMVFTVPDALTTWKWMGFAHTPAMDYGLMADTVVTSKAFMIQPNLPRFVRVGDKASMVASLVNLAEEEVKGTARLQLIDPMTDKVVYSGKEKFRVAKGETGAVRFSYEVTDRYDVLICKVVAEAGDYTDGEQHYLPVLTDKQWITETLPVQLDGKDTVTVQTDTFFNRQSPTATDRRLTVELTANPGWYVIQALPVLGHPDTEDALAWASAYYAHRLSAYLVASHPRIGQVIKSWEASGTMEEKVLSPLQKNEDVKNLLAEEMPWMMEAALETEQRRQIVGLFDQHRLEQNLSVAIRKLKELQREDGSWSWYKGMDGNLYVTTQIAEMLTRLYALTGMPDEEVQAMYTRAIGYLRKQVDKEYEQLRKQDKEGHTQGMPCTETVRFLYMNALAPDKVSLPERKQVDYLMDKLAKQPVCGIYEKAMKAIVMQANGRKQQAADLIRSVKEYTVCTREMGRYFDTPKAAYSWSSYRIPAQTAAMEAIHRLAPDERMEAEMAQWLLKQKQVQAWNTPIATADAVYAFLNGSTQPLEETGNMKATVGKENWQTPHDALGYARRTWEGKEAAPDRIVIEKTGNGIGWGAVYVQYTEQMNRVKASEGQGLSVERAYCMDGKKIGRETVLKPGDKLTVRLTIRSDRDMDFVRVKDERAACMEPVQQLSGYVWTAGLGCFRINRGASTEFFIDRLRKGTYVLEYEVYIDRSGTYQAGAASVQSVYAPEFAGHTGGEKLTVSFCGD